MSQTFKPEIIPYEREENKDVIERSKEWAQHLQNKKEILADSYFRNTTLKELEECTFQPRLIAEEKLKERNITASEMNSKIDIGVNPRSLEAFYRRMEEAHYRKKEMEEYEENYCGSGKNWQNKLTLPQIPDFHERTQQLSLDQVKCLTKPVIRNGEIVKDPVFQINRHENYKKSLETYALRGERNEEIDQIKDKNTKHKEPLFEDNVDFEDCVDFLHSQINDLET
jgi:hypothetical protein